MTDDLEEPADVHPETQRTGNARSARYELRLRRDELAAWRQAAREHGLGVADLVRYAMAHVLANRDVVAQARQAEREAFEALLVSFQRMKTSVHPPPLADAEKLLTNLPNRQNPPHMTTLPPLLTIGEVARALRVSDAKIRLMIRAGQLESLRVGVQHRIPRRALERWLDDETMADLQDLGRDHADLAARRRAR